MTRSSCFRALVIACLAIGILGVGASTGAAQHGRIRPRCVTGCGGGGTYSVSVTPDAYAFTATAGAQVTLDFTVINTGSASDTYTFTCNATGSETCGTVSPTSLTLTPDLDDDVLVTFTAGPAGTTGVIYLQASSTHGASDNGSFNVTSASYGVAVTPDGGITPSHPQNSSGYSEVFSVTNTGSTSNTFTFTCTGTGGVTCGTVPGAVTLGANGGNTTVTMPYSVGAAGTGVLTLRATGTNATDAGTDSVPILLTLSSVTGGLFTKDSRFLLQATVNTYDATGRITQGTDARGVVTNYQYGGNGNAFLTQVRQVHDGTGPIDLVTNIAYDGSGFVSSIQDPGGSFRYFTYDLYGRLRQVKNNSGTVVKAYGYVYSATSGNSWTFQSGAPNAVVDSTFLQQTPVVKAVVHTGYLDGLGRDIQSVVQDGTNSHVTATQYDLIGRVWRTWKPYTRTGAGYDPAFAANATSFYTAYHGTTATPYAETQYRPDALGRISKVIPEYLGTTPSVWTLTSYDLDANAKRVITQVTDESGNKTRSYTDIFGNQVKSVLGFGAPEATTTQFVYDVLGQRTQATDPRSLNTSYTLDTRGLLTAVASPDAGTSASKYDRGAHLRFGQDANQAAAGQVYFTTYDFAGRQLISGVGPAAFAGLDPDATSSLETTQGNWLTVRKYDAAPGGYPWTLFPTPPPLNNVGGRLAAVASQSNGAWQATFFSYDADGQVATRYVYTQANGGGSVLTALNTTVTYLRDLRGALVERDLVVGTSTFYHWYDYDNRGLLTKVYASTTPSKPGAADVTDTYRPTGQPQDYQFLGGPLVPIRYTIRGQAEQIGDPAATTYPFSAHYVYNPNGTVLQVEFYNAGSPAAQKRYRYDFPTFDYDALNRLKGADYTPWNGSSWAPTQAYDIAGITYDPAGNILSLQRYRETGTLIDNLTYTYPGNSNRLSSVNDAVGATAEPWDAETGSFTYDLNGNLVTAPAPYAITAVSYNYQNLPVSLTRSGVTTAYRYDEAGQRITKQVGSGNTEVYLRDGPTTLGVFTVNGTGTPVSWYFNLVWLDRIVGRQPNTGVRDYYHFDMLGSTRAVTQATTVVESHDYDPWGLELPARGLGGGTKEGFSGKEQDTETGLDYFGARYYMQALGRWSSVDPHSRDYLAWSSYAYVFDNPAVMVDPLGLDPYVVDCNGDNKCQKHSDEFERARQQALRSNNPDVQRAAQAYGDRGVDNGVVVSFKNPGNGLDGSTTPSLRPKDPANPTEIVGRYDVVIKPDAAGKVETVAHEGSHVADAQAFVATITPEGRYDLSKNLTSYETELRAFRVSQSVLSTSNRQASFACTNSPCVLGRGVQAPDPVINRILADPGLPYKVTPASQGDRLFPGITTPPNP